MKIRSILCGLLFVVIVFEAFYSYRFFPFEDFTTDAIFKGSMIVIALVAIWIAWTCFRRELHSGPSRVLVAIPLLLLVWLCIKAALHIPAGFLYQAVGQDPEYYRPILHGLGLCQLLLKGCLLTLVIAFLITIGINIGTRLDRTSTPSTGTLAPYPAQGDNIGKPR